MISEIIQNMCDLNDYATNDETLECILLFLDGIIESLKFNNKDRKYANNLNKAYDIIEKVYKEVKNDTN